MNGFFKTNNTSRVAKVKLYQVILMSIAAYAREMWICRKQKENKLEIWEHKI